MIYADTSVVLAQLLAEDRRPPARFWEEPLAPPVLARALEPFSKPVRTLDALYLASADFLRSRGQRLTVASYDDRMADAAISLGFEMYAL